VTTQVTIQQQTTDTTQRQVDLITTNTTVLTSYYNMNATQINNLAQAEADYYTLSGQGTIYNATAYYLAQTYQSVYDTLELSSADDLIDYVYYLNIINLNSTYNPKVMRGLTDTILNLS
jgi:hypothetical protein